MIFTAPFPSGSGFGTLKDLTILGLPGQFYLGAANNYGGVWPGAMGSCFYVDGQTGPACKISLEIYNRQTFEWSEIFALELPNGLDGATTGQLRYSFDSGDVLRARAILLGDASNDCHITLGLLP